MTIPLRDVQELALDDHEHAFYAPRGGDWVLLGLVVVVLIGNGVFAWRQLNSQGAAGEHAGRAIFFGLLLICLYWSAVLYTFKLSVSVRVGPSGMSVVRGPWRTELAWREVARLVERVQMVDRQRLRWVVALARDGRRLQIREDMVDDYIRFRMEIYERYRMWRDHGGTWGTNASGPFTARETISIQVVWWGVAAGLVVLPGLYFLILLPETGLLGPALLLIGLICAALSLRAFARRQTYVVDAKAIESRAIGKTIRLPWREVTRVDRSRHTFNAVIKAGIAVGRFALKAASRSDNRLRSFEWYPRIPEYLVLRGAGHLVRVSLHRVARPDELLAWVEFYERIGRRASTSENLRKSAPVTSPTLRDAAPLQDLSAAGGPFDPWGADQSDQAGQVAMAETANMPTLRTNGVSQVTASNAARNTDKTGDWLRGDDATERSLFDNIPTHQIPAVANRANPTSIPNTVDNAAAIAFSEEADELEDLPTAEMQSLRRPAQATPPFGTAISQPTKLPVVPVVPSEPTRSDLLSSIWAPGEPYIAGKKLSAPEEQETAEMPASPPAQAEKEAVISVDQMPTNFGIFAFDVDSINSVNALDTVDTTVADNDEALPEVTDYIAESFAPWRTEANWQPPQLPRFGPPTAPKDDAGQSEQHDSGEFRADDFLR